MDAWWLPSLLLLSLLLLLLSLPASLLLLLVLLLLLALRVLSRCASSWSATCKQSTDTRHGWEQHVKRGWQQLQHMLAVQIGSS
jgi:hypothetical protein